MTEHTRQAMVEGPSRIEPIYDVDEAVAMLTALKALVGGDVEVIHAHADEVVTRLLDGLGGGRAVAIWRALEKWYA